MRCLVRRAVSWCCLASSWRKIFSTAGAVTFVIASLPISLNTNVSSIQNALRRVGGLKLVAWAVSHSRATISKVTVLATFSSWRLVLGSMPSARSCRASSRFWRARFRGTCGYTPKLMPRCFAPTLYPREGHHGNGQDVDADRRLSSNFLLNKGLTMQRWTRIAGHGRWMVPRKGLEPPRCYPLVPETSASTNSATWAAPG